jgi:hypothetical protein
MASDIYPFAVLLSFIRAGVSAEKKFQLPDLFMLDIDDVIGRRNNSGIGFIPHPNDSNLALLVTGSVLILQVYLLSL